MIPVPKVNNASLVNHFRPVSLLPVLSKILEKVVADQITNFLNEEQILSPTQSGFRREHSTCTSLLNLTDEIFNAKNNSKCSIMSALDYTQAFDSVNHDMLISKLKYFRFDSSVLDWMATYLGGRSQITKVKGQISSPLGRMVGVPQGSCLGPILFNLYVVGMESALDYGSMHAYADDCQIILSYHPSQVAEAIRRMSSDLSKVNEWSRNHGLQLNPEKCSVVHFASSDFCENMKKNNMLVTVDQVSLPTCVKIKVLGVVIDSQMSFSSHVKQICSRVIGKIKVMNRFRTLIPQESKLKLIQSLVFPTIYYCLPVFGYCLTQELVTVLHRLQNVGLRFVYNLKKYDHITSYRNMAKVSSIQKCCDKQTVYIVHKTLVSGTPQYLREKLRQRSTMRERRTRQDALLAIPRVRLEAGRKGFSYFGPAQYNALSSQLKALSSRKFKLALKDV